MFMEHRYRLLITVGGVGGDFSTPHGQCRHLTPKSQTRDPNTFRAQYLENG